MRSAVNYPISGTKVFVGLSGGVDSSVTAALLKEAGARVTGVFIKGWYPPGMPCTWAEDRRDAMRAAAHLRIPFITLDASEEYRRSVIDYLLREYEAGRTPNPDIMCNREVKFGAFHSFAMAQGASCIATGHYARVERGAHGTEETNLPRLLRGIDPEKDQSYFLWAVPKEAIADTLFPLGEMRKADVRALAKKMRLPTALKKDSQGICFLGNVSVEEFLAQEFGAEPGKAVDETGAEVGTHHGALLSTLGQRVALSRAAPGPWFVVGKDSAKNVLVVSREKRAEARASFALSETNWLFEPVEGKEYTAQYRYHGPNVKGALNAERTVFSPSEPVPEPVASGQSLVIYDKEECVGGGIIG